MLQYFVFVFFFIYKSLLGYNEWVDIPERLGMSDWPLAILVWRGKNLNTMACNLVAMYRMMHQDPLKRLAYVVAIKTLQIQENAF